MQNRIIMGLIWDLNGISRWVSVGSVWDQYRISIRYKTIIRSLISVVYVRLGKWHLAPQKSRSSGAKSDDVRCLASESLCHHGNNQSDSSDEGGGAVVWMMSCLCSSRSNVQRG